MTPQRIRWMALIAAVLVLVLGFLSLNRTVIVMADGEVHAVSTRALLVRGALQAAGVELGPKDEVQPGQFSFLSTGMQIQVQRASRVQLFVDGQNYSMTTSERDPSVLLESFGIDLGEQDRLMLAGEKHSLSEELPQAPFLALEVRRAVTVTLESQDGTQQFLSSALTLGQALLEEGIELQSADRLEPPAETALDQPIEAKLTLAEAIEIVMGGRTIQIASAAENVGEALADAGVSLQGLDYSLPAEDEPIPGERSIEVVRVTESVELQQTVIPYAVEWVADPETELGSTSIIELGRNGVEAARVRVRYENGVEVSRDEEAQWTLVEPVTQIAGYGSEVVIRTTVIDGQEIEYWATLDMYATSYSPCRSGVEECLYGTSTSGVSVAKGVVATYLDWYRASTGVTLYVPGYGPGAIYDVGGGFPDGRAWIDLGYSDDDWVTWSQWVTVYFTTPVPDVIPYFLLP